MERTGWCGQEHSWTTPPRLRELRWLRNFFFAAQPPLLLLRRGAVAYDSAREGPNFSGHANSKFVGFAVRKLVSQIENTRQFYLLNFSPRTPKCSISNHSARGISINREWLPSCWIYRLMRTVSSGLWMKVGLEAASSPSRVLEDVYKMSKGRTGEMKWQERTPLRLEFTRIELASNVPSID
jgi:hypothetical protein